MMPKLNPRDMQKAMQRLGIKQQEIDAEEVIIKTSNKEIIIKNPEVLKVNMMGRDSFQISGSIIEKEISKISEDDINTVMEQAQVSRNEALKALEESRGDLAEAILSLKK
ncbi:MAG: nascent polypeptide-associated complex protein [Nanoarchaeota archaeon]